MWFIRNGKKYIILQNSCFVKEIIGKHNYNICSKSGHYCVFVLVWTEDMLCLSSIWDPTIVSLSPTLTFFFFFKTTKTMTMTIAAMTAIMINAIITAVVGNSEKKLYDLYDCISQVKSGCMTLWLYQTQI